MDWLEQLEHDAMNGNVAREHMAAGRPLAISIPDFRALVSMLRTSIQCIKDIECYMKVETDDRPESYMAHQNNMKALSAARKGV